MADREESNATDGSVGGTSTGAPASSGTTATQDGGRSGISGFAADVVETVRKDPDVQRALVGGAIVSLGPTLITAAAVKTAQYFQGGSGGRERHLFSG